MNGNKGLSLVELVAVITIIGLLCAAGTPIFKTAVIRAKESALLEDLKVMRRALDSFYADQQKYPERLDELVEKKYLRAIPKDPFTGQEDWLTIPSESDKYDIYDVKSASAGRSEEGLSYGDW